MKPKTNILYYFTKGREYKKAKEILDFYKIQHVEILLHERMVDRKFLQLILGYCENGFDDLIKNKNKVNQSILGEDYEDLTVNEVIQIMVEQRDYIMKPVFFLGMRKAEPYGKVISKLTDDEFTAFRPYNEREMSRIYE